VSPEVRKKKETRPRSRETENAREDTEKVRKKLEESVCREAMAGENAGPARRTTARQLGLPSSDLVRTKARTQTQKRRERCAKIACPSIGPGEGAYIRKSEIVGTSTLRASRVEGEGDKRKTKINAVLPATDPRGDDDEGSGI